MLTKDNNGEEMMFNENKKEKGGLKKFFIQVFIWVLIAVTINVIFETFVFERNDDDSINYQVQEIPKTRHKNTFSTAGTTNVEPANFPFIQEDLKDGEELKKGTEIKISVTTLDLNQDVTNSVEHVGYAWDKNEETLITPTEISYSNGKHVYAASIPVPSDLSSSVKHHVHICAKSSFIGIDRYDEREYDINIKD